MFVRGPGAIYNDPEPEHVQYNLVGYNFFKHELAVFAVLHHANRI
jgi:hypothetical protein